ncbi:GtrA family protein [Peribacillus sp. SCS-37]|uniref:GtrA family protein n=1 Tax=Paraperibacillus esterisolvens TaxID=3115296 RepID=UPI003905C5EE
MALPLRNSLKNQTSQLFRFLLVGLINTCIGLSLIFISKNLFLLGYWPSVWIGNGAGAAASFFLNRSFTFRSNAALGNGSLKFLAVVIVSLLAGYSLGRMAALHAAVILPSGPGNAENDAVWMGAVIYTMLNYLGQKYIVFKVRSTL